MIVKNLFRELSLVFLFILFFLKINAQVPSDIIYSIKTGNTAKLVTFFNSEVELSINEKEGNYTLSKAETILKIFFTENKPISFEVKHNGNQGELQFVIGELQTKNNKYRTYIYTKLVNNKKRIYQLRFEKQ